MQVDTGIQTEGRLIGMTSIFISHASPDRAFALRLARSLQQLGHTVWVDAQQIQVGDSIPQRVAKAIESTDYLIVVLSKHSAASSWSEQEWQAKYWDEVVCRQTFVLPVVLEDCVIPLFLRPKRHADFRSEYAVGVAQLAIMLDKHSHVAAEQARIDHCSGSEQDIEHRLGTVSRVSSRCPFCYTDDTMKRLGRLVEVNAALDIPYLGKITGVWKPDEHEQAAAWEMYVELVTRIAVAELTPNDGLLRESLSSLYGMFTTTRQILRKYGPEVARPKEESELSFGYLAISILNFVLRPVLAKWHPLLLDYEHRRDGSVSALEHEQRWEKAAELRQELNQVRFVLLEYTNLLARISRIPTTMP